MRKILPFFFLLPVLCWGSLSVNPPISTTTPTILNGILKGNGSTVGVATPGTDYQATPTPPGGSSTQIQFNDSNSFGGLGSWDGVVAASTAWRADKGLVAATDACVIVQHGDGSFTNYSRSGGLGAALLSAVSAITSGDTLWLSAGTFYINTTRIDLSKGDTATGVSMIGSGEDATIISSNVHGISSGASIEPSDGGCIMQLQIVTNAPTDYSYPLGIAGTSRTINSLFVRDVSIEGGSDGLYFRNNSDVTATFVNVSVRSRWDTLAFSGGVKTFTFYNCDLCVEGNFPGAMNTNGVHAITNTTPDLTFYNSTIESIGFNANGLYFESGIEGTVRMYGGGISTSGTGTTYDLNFVSPIGITFDKEVFYNPSKTSTAGATIVIVDPPVWSTPANPIDLTSTPTFGQPMRGSGVVDVAENLIVRKKLTDSRGVTGNIGQVLSAQANGVQFIDLPALTPWTSDIDANGYSLSNVNSLSAGSLVVAGPTTLGGYLDVQTDTPVPGTDAGLRVYSPDQGVAMRCEGNSYAKIEFISDNSGTVDTGKYQMYSRNDGGNPPNFHFGALNDAESYEVPIWDVYRSSDGVGGMMVDSFNLYATNTNISNALTVNSAGGNLGNSFVVLDVNTGFALYVSNQDGNGYGDYVGTINNVLDDGTGGSSFVKLGVTYGLSCQNLYVGNVGSSTMVCADGSGMFAAATAGTDYPGLASANTWAGAQTFNALIKPQQHTTTGAPSYVKGAIYFDTTLKKLRVGGATGWETVTSL